MANQPEEFERVLGPYVSRKNRWTIILVGRGGRRVALYRSTEADARALAKKLREKVEGIPLLSVEAALAAYERFRRDKGNKPNSVKETSRRLDAFFTEPHLNLWALTPDRCEKYYRKFVDDGLRADSHRNYLAEARSFLKWCHKQRWLKANPLDGIEGVGRRRHGKPQLRIDEARKFVNAALAAKTEGATMALMALMLGLRVSEVIERVVRDVDDGGRVLWIPETKTDAGRRTLQIPTELQPLIAALRWTQPSGRVAARIPPREKRPTEYLFPARAGDRYLHGHRSRRWALEQIHALCLAAGVSKVSVHSLRGLHGTLAIQAGATPHLVAQALGHESFSTTAESYVAPGTVSEVRSQRANDRLKGG